MMDAVSPKNPAPDFARSIHLLYVPTLYCNLDCSYCYLGEQTRQATLKTDAQRAVATLEHALAALRAAGVLAFNVSLHGGEVTTLPPTVLKELFVVIRRHYLEHFDAITAFGHRKSVPHIKTNLYQFAPLYDLFAHHKISISASIDLPLALHARHRKTRRGESWLERTLDNLRLLARYPHAKKISATLSAEHLQNPQALIDDIWFIHRELGFDMNQLNLMFAFASELNRQKPGGGALTPASATQQVALYEALRDAFMGTELEEGLRRHWFDEFTPSYCTNAINCGERFYLLQSDGAVYSCVRGQGIEAFHYGNIFQQPVDEILANGARRIAHLHQQYGFDAGCGECSHLALCHTGCPAVKYQEKSGRSYTCQLQQAIYRDNPHSYPASSAEEQAAQARQYVFDVHPALAPAWPQPQVNAPALPGELAENRNNLRSLIAADALLRELYSAQAFVIELNGELIELASQLLQQQRHWHTLTQGDTIRLHVRRDLFDANCPEPIRNTLYLQMLRDTPVVYGDEQRSKQEHLFTYQIYRNCLAESDRLGNDFLMADIGGIIALHHAHYHRGVLNNLLVTTLFLREYHYQKQKNNAFYHIQAVNLPFQNFEFHYLP